LFRLRGILALQAGTEISDTFAQFTADLTQAADTEQQDDDQEDDQQFRRAEIRHTSLQTGMDFPEARILPPSAWRFETGGAGDRRRVIAPAGYGSFKVRGASTSACAPPFGLIH
jgi:hypothetical protein